MQTSRLVPAMLALGCAMIFNPLQSSAQNAPPMPPNGAPDPGAATVDAGKSAGGKWIETAAIEEKMTGKRRIRFELEADNFLPGAEARPKLILFCVDGKLKLGDFRPNVRLAPPNRMSFVGRPQLKVMVRVDNTHYNKNWNWVNGDFLAMDDDTVRKLIRSSIFKVQIDTRQGPQIAEFSTGGLDLNIVKQDCNLKPLGHNY
jgi:hypothetical protein